MAELPPMTTSTTHQDRPSATNNITIGGTTSLAVQAEREGRDHTFELVTRQPRLLGVPDPLATTETHLTRALAQSGERKNESGCYATLLTRQSYLPGLVILWRSLRLVESKYPLLVLYTDTLESEAVETLKQLGIEHTRVEAIRPPANVSLIAERFADTWTKLRVLELTAYERVVMIDNDMMVLQNMDELFTAPLEDGHILASHGCICNLDDSDWAPTDWTRDNCPFTPQTPTDALLHPAGTHTSLPPGYHQLNSGLVVLRPHADYAEQVRSYMHTPRDGELFQFPDQDVLVAVFGKGHGKWTSLAWTYNAVKISRDWHRESWIDAGVKNLHYICDKPWKDARGRRIARMLREKEIEEREADELDPYLHRWWWRQWHDEVSELESRSCGVELVRYLESLVVQ